MFFCIYNLLIWIIWTKVLLLYSKEHIYASYVSFSLNLSTTICCFAIILFLPDSFLTLKKVGFIKKESQFQNKVSYRMSTDKKYGLLLIICFNELQMRLK